MIISIFQVLFNQSQCQQVREAPIKKTSRGVRGGAENAQEASSGLPDMALML
jgi:hypothetical protein